VIDKATSSTLCGLFAFIGVLTPNWLAQCCFAYDKTRLEGLKVG